MQILKLYRQKVKNDMTSTMEVFSKLRQKKSSKPFEPIDDIFTDGFSITNPILPLSWFVEFIKNECNINVFSSKITWQKKYNKDAPKRFFIRLDDKSAIITNKLLKKIAKGMNKYRRYLFAKLVEKEFDAKKTRSDISEK